MITSFLDHIKTLEDRRIVGMITYPLDEVLLTVLVGLLCRVEDFEEIEMVCKAQLGWFRRFLPFEAGIAQTQRRVLRTLAPRTLENAFTSWVSSLQATIRGVVAIDGKSNETTAIPDVLNMLEISGAIVTIDAIGTQTAIAAQIIKKKANYLLALKGNQKTLHDDVVDFFSDPALAAAGAICTDTAFGHGRIEERTCRAVPAEGWLVARHPKWKNLCSIAEVTVQRTIKKTGKTSGETRYYISSLAANPEIILAASRSHWSVENNVPQTKTSQGRH